MYKAINGWTKETMIQHVMDNFKGKSMGSLEKYGSPICAYRGQHDKKCSVGLFIPDSIYDVNFEGNNVEAIYNQIADEMPLKVSDLTRFQDMHDNWQGSDDELKTELISWIRSNVE